MQFFNMADVACVHACHLITGLEFGSRRFHAHAERDPGNSGGALPTCDLNGRHHSPLAMGIKLQVQVCSLAKVISVWIRRVCHYLGQ